MWPIFTNDSLPSKLNFCLRQFFFIIIIHGDFMSISIYALMFGFWSLVGFAIVVFLFFNIMRMKVHHEKAARIAKAIQTGAMTFLREEYKIIAVVTVIIAVLLSFYLSPLSGLMFIIGALFSLTTGLIGMRAATEANVRTALAAKEKGENQAFLMAFFGGGVMGFAVASFGLLGLGAIFYFFFDHPNFIWLLTSFSFGGSLVAFFARVGGGIYTKSADVGADLVGKIEAGIPEDDPRNPAVIADNVGDCVGDTAGMGADIYESYVGAMVSSIILAKHGHGHNLVYLTLPLILAALGLASSAVGLFANFFLKLQPAAMLRNALYIAMGVLLVGMYGYISYMDLGFDLFISIILGCVAGVVF